MPTSDFFIPTDVIANEVSREIQFRWQALFDSTSRQSVCGVGYTLQLGGTEPVPIVPTRVQASVVSLRREPAESERGAGFYASGVPANPSSLRGAPQNSPVICSIELTVHVAPVQEMIASNAAPAREIPLTIQLEYRAFLALSPNPLSEPPLAPGPLRRRIEFLVVERIGPISAAVLEFGANSGPLGTQLALFGDSLDRISDLFDRLSRTETRVGNVLVRKAAVPLNAVGLSFMAEPNLGFRGPWNVASVATVDGEGVLVRAEFLTEVDFDSSEGHIARAAPMWRTFFQAPPRSPPVFASARELRARFPTEVIAAKVNDIAGTAVPTDRVDRMGVPNVVIRTAGPTTVILEEAGRPVFATRFGVALPNACAGVWLFADVTMRTRIVGTAADGSLQLRSTIGVELEPSSTALCLTLVAGIGATLAAGAFFFFSGVGLTLAGVASTAFTAGLPVGVGAGFGAVNAVALVLGAVMGAIGTRLRNLPLVSNADPLLGVGITASPVAGTVGEMDIRFILPPLGVAATRWPLRLVSQSVRFVDLAATPPVRRRGRLLIDDVQAMNWRIRGDCNDAVSIDPRASATIRNVGDGPVTLCDSPFFSSTDPTGSSMFPGPAGQLLQSITFRSTATDEQLTGMIVVPPGGAVRVAVSFDVSNTLAFAGSNPSPAVRRRLERPVLVGFQSSAGTRVLSLGTYVAAAMSRSDVQFLRDLYIRDRCMRPANERERRPLGGRFHLPVTATPTPPPSAFIVSTMLRRAAGGDAKPKQSFVTRLAAGNASVPKVHRLPSLPAR